MTTIKKAAEQRATLQNTHRNYSNLAPLVGIRQAGLMPKHGLIWLGLGHMPPKRSALSIDPDSLPSDEECRSVAGLDVILCIHGFITKYGALRRLAGSLLASRPNRLLLVDLDYKQIAYLKTGGVR